MRVLKVIARLLDYPTTGLQDARDGLTSIILEDRNLTPRLKSGLLRTIDTLCSGDLMDHQENYVALFDRGRSLSLLLFEHVHGESRDRGQAMVDLMRHYEQAGLTLAERELPDYLPLFLEFLSTQGEEAIHHWLEDTQPILALLAERLYQRDSHYSALLEALLGLCNQAPPDRRQLAAKVAEEEPDDTPQALDAVWEEEMVRFVDDQGSSCATRGVVSQRREELGRVQPIHLSGGLAEDASAPGGRT